MDGLRRVRDANALSQKELAELAGLTNVTVSLIENGQPARPSTVRKLANALNVPPEELLYKEVTDIPLGKRLAGYPKRAAHQLAGLLERDLALAQHSGDPEALASVSAKAWKAYTSLKERKSRGEDMPDHLIRWYELIIGQALDYAERKQRRADEREDALLRELELEQV